MGQKKGGNRACLDTTKKPKGESIRKQRLLRQQKPLREQVRHALRKHQAEWAQACRSTLRKEQHAIADGEKRYRAHLLLGERYGEHWYMVPARAFGLGELSDEDAMFMLHAKNVGQRAMTPSERARGVAAVADRIIARRKADPTYAQGRNTKELISEQFGVSERTAVMETNIGRNLGEKDMAAYDAGTITKIGADAISKLDEEEQERIVEQVESGEITKEEVPSVARGSKPESSRISRHADEDLKVARQALKRALKKGESPDRVIVAEIRNLLDKLDPDK